MLFNMEVFLITFQAVAALLGIGVLGFWIIGRKKVPSSVLALLTSISIDIALPCLILSSILVQFSPQDMPDWWHMPLWWVGFCVAALALSLISGFLVKKEFRSEFVISLFFQNGIFFPLIIITGLFGINSPYLVLLFLFIFISPSLTFSTYTLFFRQHTRGPALVWSRVINPTLVMTAIGLILGLLNIKGYIPDFLMMILAMVGATATPLLMMILGGNVYNDFMNRTAGDRRIYTGEVIKFIIVKNLAFPLVFLGLLIWLRPDFPVALIMILEAAVPPITAIPIFTERGGGNRAIANQFIVASFAASIITIPAVIFLFTRFFPFP
jgi:malate permease and related proteins